MDRSLTARLDTVSFVLLLFVLAFAPLAFGTVEHWSKTVAYLGIGAALLSGLFSLMRSSEPLPRPPGLLPLLLLLGVVALQLVPLPISLLKVISPHGWEAYRPVYEQLNGDDWLPLSVHPKATLQEFFRLGAGVLLYLLTVHALRRGPRVKRTVGLVVGLGGVIAFFAILQQFSADGEIYWFRPAPGGNPGGPWVNINQYAAFIEAVCPLALALFLFYRPSMNGDASWRERLISFFSSPRSNRHLFLGFAFVLLGFSVFVSLCRGGIITILLSMVLFAGLKGVVQRRTGSINLWVGLCLVLLAVSWFGWQPILDEFQKGIGVDWTIRDVRTTLYRDTLTMIGDFWLFGSGFGTFVDVYPSYKTVLTDRVFEHAHNDYLELLSDGGIVSFVLMSWFVVAVVRRGWQRTTRRRDRYAVLVGIGCLSSIGALLLHSVVDFNLQNGAIGLYFFFLCGLLTAAVNTRYRYYETEPLLGPAGRRSIVALVCFTALFLGAVGTVQVGIMAAANSFSQVRSVYISSHLDPALLQRVVDGVEKARSGDPLEAYYPFYRGNLAVLQEGRERAAHWYRQAALLRPMEGVYLQRVGLMLPPERQEEATRLLTEGYRRAMLKERLLFSWAEWLLVTDQRQEALALIKAWFVRDPGKAAELIPLLETHQFSRQEVSEALPPSVEAWIRLGVYKENMGRIEEAGYYRSEALRFIDREKTIKPQWFSQLIDYYRRRQQPDAALAVLRRAVEACPEYAPFHIQLGDSYVKEQIWYRALEEYQKAVALEPANESYRRRLRTLELDLEFGR